MSVKSVVSVICLFFSVYFGFSCCANTNDSINPRSWIKYPDNPVLSADHGGINNYDHFNINDCCVVKDGFYYKMWYTSGGFTPPDTVNHCSISYAISVDGITWDKYSGNPVLNNDADAWDAYAVETVSVLIDTDAHESERYKMWYAGRTLPYESGGPAYDFGYAVSADGIFWTKYAGNPVLLKGIAAEWDNDFIEGPTVIKDGLGYKMWYAGFDAVADGQITDGKVSIGLATSPDGLIWTKYSGNPVLLVGPAENWDCKTVQDPHVVKHDGVYHMWYGGANYYDFEKYGQQTGYAFSIDGVSWQKSSRNPVLQRGSVGAWDANTASFGSVLIEGETVKMWYTGKDQDNPIALPYFWDIGYVHSSILEALIAE